ncbi:MAG: PEGA domain-containing protein [Bacteroidota bacterium]
MDAQAQSVLHIVSEPPAARISVDGEAVGIGRVEVDVTPGEHRVRATMALHEPVEEVVRVASGDTLTVRLALQPTPGRVHVVGLPEAATVDTPGWQLVDGEAVLPPGVSTIQVQVPGLPSMSARFEVDAGAVTTVEYADVLRVRGFASNIVLPGSAQIRQGRPLVGAAFAVGVGVGIGGAFAMSGPITEADEDLVSATAVYDAARSEAEVREALAQVDDTYDRTRSTRYLRAGIVAATVAVYAGSLVDGVLRHGGRPGLRVRGPEARSEWTLRPTAQGLTASLTF